MGRAENGRRYLNPKRHAPREHPTMTTSEADMSVHSDGKRLWFSRLIAGLIPIVGIVTVSSAQFKSVGHTSFLTENGARTYLTATETTPTRSPSAERYWIAAAEVIGSDVASWAYFRYIRGDYWARIDIHLIPYTEWREERGIRGPHERRNTLSAERRDGAWIGLSALRPAGRLSTAPHHHGFQLGRTAVRKISDKLTTCPTILQEEDSLSCPSPHNCESS